MLHTASYGKGTPLVLLHGWGWDSSIWKPLLPALTQNYQVVLVDLPGCGQSTSLPSYSLEAVIESLLEVAPPSAIWVGWSLGGMLAWVIALRNPERVSKLVTIATSPRFVEDTAWPGVALPTLQRFANALQTHYEATLRDFIALQLRGSLHADTLLKTLTEQLPHAEPAALLGGLHLLETIDLRETYMQLTQSSLHFFGQYDVLVPERVSNLIAPHLPLGQCITIKRAGHIPFLSQQAVFLEALHTHHNNI